MVSMTEQPTARLDVFQAYVCYWVAFNNIYTYAAEHKGVGIEVKLGKDGKPKTKRKANVNVPVAVPNEQEQIMSAFEELLDDVRTAMVEHPNARFFVDRVPRWRGKELKYDADKQRLNGVLSVGLTTNTDHPVWSPVDRQLFDKYAQGERSAEARSELALQLLFVLYTVRNNAFHAGKLPSDANDIEVFEKALPLLRLVVRSFMYPGHV
jgi:hypothetical protein